MLALFNLLRLIYESAPKNPDLIVIKNEFYPKGLTERDIYEYYMKHKNLILKEVSGRELMLFLAVDTNKFIVKRHLGSSSDYIEIDKYNYDKVISGRTVSIHSTFKAKEKFGIVDIDCADFDQAKASAAEIYDLLFKVNKNLKIKFTGKDSFHILYYFDKEHDIRSIKSHLLHVLMNLAGKKPQYTINKTRSPDKINLDLSSNKFRGGFITTNSLSILGLRSMIVSRNDILKFNKNKAKIK